jgi:hypothetical protein
LRGEGCVYVAFGHERRKSSQNSPFKRICVIFALIL